MADVTAIIQARVGSTRLPGKVIYPLNGRPVLEHVTKRVAESDTVTDVVVATSTEPQDDVIEQYMQDLEAESIRGSESDVLSRFERAVDRYEPDIVVRVTGDCPLIDPTTIDTVIEDLKESGADYVSNISERTFPRGLDVEAFTVDAFGEILREATKQRHREHVTPYFRENSDRFVLESTTSEQVFDKDWLQNRSDLRLTLDEAADYAVLRRIYETVPYEGTLPIRDAIQYVDEHGLMELNESVRQKEI